MRCLRSEYGNKLRIENEKDDTLVDLFETDFYKETKKRMTPGTYLRIYRENHHMTQEKLGDKIGASKAFVCDMEHDRRAISKDMAKKLAALFDISVARFI
ncbi:MAG: helix-turn-helix transcriptional regulator [Chitinispirillaceae bacterium]|nr:helix-turn-helix transcriptional regulator [Chitinispirillaceae bacterium]